MGGIPSLPQVHSLSELMKQLQTQVPLTHATGVGRARCRGGKDAGALPAALRFVWSGLCEWEEGNFKQEKQHEQSRGLGDKKGWIQVWGLGYRVSGQKKWQRGRRAGRGAREGPLRRETSTALEQGQRARGLTSVVINTVGLHKRDGDGLAQRVLVLLQLGLPEDGIPILAEVLLGPMATRELPGALLLAKHRHSVQAIVADVVAGDVGQAGRHHPHTTALISWDSESSWSPTEQRVTASSVSHEGKQKRHWPGPQSP